MIVTQTEAPGTSASSATAAGVTSATIGMAPPTRTRTRSSRSSIVPDGGRTGECHPLRLAAGKRRGPARGVGAKLETVEPLVGGRGGGAPPDALKRAIRAGYVRKSDRAAYAARAEAVTIPD